MVKKVKKKTQPKLPDTLEGLLQLAEQHMQQFRFEEAVNVLTRAQPMAPTDTGIMDLLAQAHMELGDTDKARVLLQESVRLAPDSGPEKWLDLGQLSPGRPAIQCFQKAIDLFMAQIAAGAAGELASELANQMSTAYCSMGEIFTTDLCDEPDAEMECERVLRLAVAAFEQNPEAHSALANLRLIQGRQQEAATHTQRAFELYNNSDEGGDMCGSYESRTSCAKLCVELKMFTEAAELLEGLLEEDDRFVEIWYLAGLSYRNLKEYSTAQEYLQRAEEMMQKSMASVSENKGEDSKEDNEESQELLAKIQQELQSIEPRHLAAEQAEEEQLENEEESDDDEEMTVHT